MTKEDIHVQIDRRIMVEVRLWADAHGGISAAAAISVLLRRGLDAVRRDEA